MKNRTAPRIAETLCPQEGVSGSVVGCRDRDLFRIQDEACPESLVLNPGQDSLCLNIEIIRELKLNNDDAFYNNDSRRLAATATYSIGQPDRPGRGHCGMWRLCKHLLTICLLIFYRHFVLVLYSKQNKPQLAPRTKDGKPSGVAAYVECIDRIFCVKTPSGGPSRAHHDQQRTTSRTLFYALLTTTGTAGCP